MIALSCAHLGATWRHLPYGITLCYLPPNTSEHAPPNPSQTGRYEGWVDLVTGYIQRWFTRPQTVGNRSSNPLALGWSRTRNLLITSLVMNKASTNEGQNGKLDQLIQLLRNWWRDMMAWSAVWQINVTLSLWGKWKRAYKPLKKNCLELRVTWIIVSSECDTAVEGLLSSLESKLASTSILWKIVMQWLCLRRAVNVTSWL